jgi:hypothetical protein
VQQKAKFALAVDMSFMGQVPHLPSQDMSRQQEHAAMMFGETLYLEWSKSVFAHYLLVATV